MSQWESEDVIFQIDLASDKFNDLINANTYIKHHHHNMWNNKLYASIIAKKS